MAQIFAKRTVKLTPSFINSVVNTRPHPFKNNPLADTTNIRTYARQKEDGTRENIAEIFERVVNGTIGMEEDYLRKHNLYHKFDAAATKAFAERMFEVMYAFKFTPPGRGLWAMGGPITEERRIFAALNNCGFVSTQDWWDNENPAEAMTFLMDASMLGIGVGFDTKGAGAVEISKTFNITEQAFTIPDSREGWVEALHLMVSHYVNDTPKPVFDYTQIRPAGAPIKGFGGESAGYEVLKRMLDEIADVFERYRGKKLDSRAIVDIMNMIGKCVISGNVRRSAEIAFGAPTDNGFLNLKNYTRNPERMEYGWVSNNSVFATVGMDYRPMVDRIIDNGEPGFIWLDNMQRYSRMCDPPDDRDHRVQGSNPCFTRNTLILTTEGLFEAGWLVKKPFDVVVHGKVYHSPTGVFYTGTKMTYKVETYEGHTITLTEDHLVMTADKEWVPCKDLVDGDKIVLNNCFDGIEWGGKGTKEDGYFIGSMARFTFAEQLANIELAEKIEAFQEGWATNHGMLHETGFSHAVLLGIIQVLFDYNSIVEEEQIVVTPPVTGNGMRDEFGNDMTQPVLLCFGINSVMSDDKTSIFIRGDDIKAFYHHFKNTTEEKRVLLEHLMDRVGRDVIPNRLLVATFKEARQDGEKGVYDCTVEEVHCLNANGMIIHNCVEQSLESRELCCLAETYLNNHSDIKDFMNSLAIAARYCKTVTLGMTEWPQTNLVITRNRRMGISQTGIAQFITKYGKELLAQWCRRGYQWVRQQDRELSAYFEVNESVKMTSVKPSGTVSLLAGATPGIHYPISPYYIRRIRLPTNSPLIPCLNRAGYLTQTVENEPNTVVVEFPVTAGDNIRCQHQVSLYEQMELAAFMQHYWADNSVSATFTFDPTTTNAEQIVEYLNFFQHHLKGASFLPLSPELFKKYKHAPYEPISKKEYTRLLKNKKPIDWTVKGDALDRARVNEYCDADKCTI